MNDLRTTLRFLSALKKHNHRKWFAAHKAEYDAARSAMEDFLFEVIHGIAEFDHSIGPVEPKDCLFRIHRDTRFSSDKTPYKTNMGAVIAPGGRKTSTACYYLHVEPGASMLGGGVYMPPPDKLKSIRQLISHEGATLRKVLQEPASRKCFGGLWDEDKLTRPPKGFDASDPWIDYIKNKHFVLLHEFKDREITSSAFLRSVLRCFRLMKPFKDFLNRAV
jgi:uncharacterized protein (TIGR02453 family)